MAGPTVKEILLKWGIDNSNWKKAITELSVLLDKSNKEHAKSQDQALKRLEAQKTKIKEIVADQKSETAEIEKQIGKLKVKAAAAGVAKADAVARLATEKASSAEASKQAVMQKSLQAIQKTLQQEVYTKLMNEKLVTAEINKQNASLRLQAAQQRAAGGGIGGRRPPGGAGGGFFGGMMGVFGSRFGGTLTSAVAMGELAAHSIEGLLEKVKRFVEMSGPLEQVREQFEKLASIKGVDAVKFLEDLRKSTHGLVADVELYRTANKFMQSGIKTTAEDMSRLVQATVGLARSQGRDATQAVHALNMSLATGRFQRLAYITGLTREEMTVRGLSATMSSHQRIQLQYEQALKKITDRYRQFGEPALTVTELMKQLDVATTRLFENFARGVVQSRGIAAVFEFIGETIKKLTSEEGGVESLGQKLADGFIPVVEVFKTLKTVVTEVIGLFASMGKIVPGTGSSFATFTGFMKTVAGAVVLIREGIEQVMLSVKSQLGVGPAGLKGLVIPGFLLPSVAKERRSIRDKALEDLERLEGEFAAPQVKPKLGGATGTGTTDEQERNIALQRQLRQLRLKGLELDAKMELSLEKGKLEALKQANEEAYDVGIESIDEYLTRKKAIQNLELQATLKEIADEKKARLAELAEKSKEEFMAPEAYKRARANIEKESAEKEINARNATQRALDALDLKATADRLAARKKLTDAIEALEKAQVQRTREVTEYAFKQGEISAQEYLDKRVQFIEEDYQAVKTAEEKKLAENKFSESARAEFSGKMAKAAEDREKALTQLSLSEIEIRTKAVEESYGRAQKLIETQITYQQSLGKEDYFGGGREEEQRLIEVQISLLKSRLEQEVKSLTLMKAGTEQWAEQQTKIMATKEALVKYNEELVKAHDYLSGMATAVKELSGAAGKYPKGGPRVAEGLGVLAGGLEQAEKYRQSIAARAAAEAARKAGTVAAPVTPEEIFKSLQSVSKAAGEDLGGHLKKASESVEEWRRQMVTDGLLLDSSIKQTTQALLEQLIPAIQKTAGAAAGAAGGGGRARILSGQATAGSPLGTATASDLEMLQPAWLTSLPKDGLAALSTAATPAAVGLSQVAQHTPGVADSFKQLVSNSIGDDGLIGVFKNMGNTGGLASKNLSNFTDSISNVAGAIGGIATAAKGTGGPFQSGMQGMQGGLQLGLMIGGPIGGAVGAGLGLVMGVFSGKAKKEAEKIAKGIVAKFDAVLAGVQQGTVGLGEAVTAEIATIQSAVAQLSSKKGGRDELKKILPQMEQQLLQLQIQQQQVIKSFDQQLEVLRAPQAFQELIKPVDDIIQKYKDYVLAGGNLTLANEYLQRSFQNLVVQGLDQLNQSEQDAINNALQYNDLLLQRQQLIQDTNQQIQDIMSQGVAVRLMPQGVTKARELQQLMLRSQNQLAQMDQEIAVSKHKLDNESKIFALATTRVGLETQLVALQDAQINKQDLSTAALLREVAAFASGTPTNIPTALNMLGLGGAYIGPGAEPALKPTPPVKTGIYEVDLQNQLQYQQALDFYNQQLALSGGAALPALGGLPGGTMGLTLAGATAGAGATTQVGAILDSLASNVTAFPEALANVFKDANTIVNVGGTLLQQIASALGVKTGAPMPAAAASVGGGAYRAGPASVTVPLVAAAMSAQQAQVDAHVSASTARHVIESNITQLSATRVQQEVMLVHMKVAEINMDMKRMQVLSDLINTKKSSGSITLEDMLQNVYTTRGRQGFGGFYGETNNAL